MQRFVFRNQDGQTRAIEAACAENAAHHYPPPRWAQIEPPVREGQIAAAVEEES